MQVKGILSRVVPFLVAFLVVGGLLHWWQARETPGPAPEEERVVKSLLEYEEEYRDSVQVARWIFDNHNCRTCHTLSETGAMGLTEEGRRVGKDFMGCPGMLTTVMETVGVPENQWSEHQRKVRADFDRFGCTTCHQVTETGVELTEIGSRAAVLHMSCSGVMSTLVRSHQQ